MSEYQLDSLCSEDVTVEIEKDLTEFCAQAEVDEKHPVENWAGRAWQTNSSTLLYCLLIEKRFSRDLGKLFILRHLGKIIAVSGVYRSDFHPQIFIGGVRTLTLPEFRSRGRQERTTFHSDRLFPAQLQWAREMGAKAFLMTFNDHNFWLAQIALRAATGRAAFLGLPMGAAAQQFYEGFELCPKKLFIKFVYQHTLIKKLDPEFNYSFQSMEEP